MNCGLTVLILLAVTAAGTVYGQDTSVVRAPVNICTGFGINQYIPDYSDCTRFFHCDETGTPRHETCINGWHFDLLNGCVTSNTATCFKCPENEYFIDLPIENNCRQFVRCFAGEARQQTCTDGLLFDSARQQCNFQEHVSCSCSMRDIPGRPLFYRDPENCAK